LKGLIYEALVEVVVRFNESLTYCFLFCKFDYSNTIAMVTVKIKENSKQAKAVVEMLRTFSFVEIVEKPRYNAETEKAISDMRAGRGIHRAKNVDDLFKKLNA
jgi:hypothetical protein